MDHFKKGSTLGVYKLIRCIGKGAYGTVWAAKKIDRDEDYAIKIEIPNKGGSLKNEAEIGLDITGNESFAKYYEYGTFNNFNYLSMELLQMSIKMYQETILNTNLSLYQAGLTGLSMLKCIRSFHESGYVHRDIKPANFVFRGKFDDHKLCLVDFGLSKKWREKDGRVLPPRSKVGFRGTLSYASLNSHAGLDLGPRDDLWSFYYTFVELCSSHLPWKSMTDKNSVFQIKNRGIKNIIIGLPPQFGIFAAKISDLKYEEFPDYDYLESLIEEIIKIGEHENSQDSSISLVSQYVSTSILYPQSIYSECSSSLVAGSWDPVFSWKSTEKENNGCCFLI